MRAPFLGFGASGGPITVWSATDKDVSVAVQTDARVLGASAGTAGNGRATVFRDVSTGTFGIGFTVTGSGSPFVGFGNASAGLTSQVGLSANGVSLRLTSGNVAVDGSTVVTGLSSPLGSEVFFRIGPSGFTVYIDGAQIGTTFSLIAGSKLVAPMANPATAGNLVTLKRALSELTYPAPAAGATMWG